MGSVPIGKLVAFTGGATVLTVAGECDLANDYFRFFRDDDDDDDCWDCDWYDYGYYYEECYYPYCKGGAGDGDDGGGGGKPMRR